MKIGSSTMLCIALVIAAPGSPARAEPLRGTAVLAEIPSPGDDASAEIDALHPAMVAKARKMGLTVAPAATTTTAGFQFPLRSDPPARGYHQHTVSNHVDLDPTSGLKDYNCGTRTYDGHKGTDLSLTPFGWDVMARKEVAVVAALGGTIVEKQDGQFDQQCSWGGTQPANYVIVNHDNGMMGYYWHMKKGSVTAKVVGSRVETGDVLGHVGSSGRSTGPHLHFELRDSSGASVEPAHGPCHAPATRWTTQAAPLDTAVVRVATHSRDLPSWTDPCDKPDPHYSDRFSPGQTVYFAGYMRDHAAGISGTLELVDPSGATVLSFSTGSPSSGFYKASYAYWWYKLPSNAPTGSWRVRMTLQGKVHEHVFTVGTAPPTATITAAVTGTATLKLTIGKLVTTRARVSNTSSRDAVGCFVSAVRPMRVRSGYQADGFDVDEAFTVPAGGNRYLTLRLTATGGFAAKQASVPVFVRCTNALGAAHSAKTLLTLSGP